MSDLNAKYLESSLIAKHFESEELTILMFIKEADNELIVLDTTYLADVNEIEFSVLVMNHENQFIYHETFDNDREAIDDALRFMKAEYEL
jgi:response regulator of citrate/malate metabolism